MGAANAFAALFGLLLGIGLLKFGNPVILDHRVEMPRTLDEWRVFSWPIWIGHVGLAGVVLAGLALIGRRWQVLAPLPIFATLAAWLLWQGAAALVSVDPALTRVILLHFAACAVCFGLGHLALGRTPDPRVFWICLMAGFAGELGMAMQQRFGGLEETRRMILQGGLATQLPPDYLARIQSNRVFGTLVYPNALAGAILLLLPIATVLAARLGERRGRGAAFAMGAAALTLGLAVLVWSGSKAGWLLAMGVALFLLFHGPMGRRVKVGLAAGLVVVGLAGFAVVFADKLRGGATSVGARFDYWSAGVHGVVSRPLLGHGPGGFKTVYARVKSPESEMAQLAHNDYLQQAVDSGLPGAVAYLGFVVGALVHAYRRIWPTGDALLRAVWLGLAAWWTQGLVEFGLYIPATAWCAFAMLGWLLRRCSDGPTPAPGVRQGAALT